jgi:hypothetical protein
MSRIVLAQTDNALAKVVVIEVFHMILIAATFTSHIARRWGD